MTATFEAVASDLPPAEHGEGPLWDPALGILFFVDQYRGMIRRASWTDGGLVAEPSLEVPAPVGAIVPRASAGWAVAAGSGMHLLRADGTIERTVDVLPDDGVARRMNDGKADPRGAFWFGTMALDRRPGAGSLYRVEHDRVTTALGAVKGSGTTISNGLAWDDSGDRMWFIDTPTHRVERFRVTSREVEHDGTAVEIDPAVGDPDGMTIDEEGCLWVALWSGGAVHRYSPAGELLGRVEVGARQVSSCCFGGPDLATLMITTSAEGYGEAELEADPLAGRIFTAETGVRGRSADAYDG